jgi:hypothetical protein
MYVQVLENLLYKVVEIPAKNYTGTALAETLSVAINAAWYPDWNLKFDVLYDFNDNMIMIKQLKYTDGGVDVYLVSGADLQAGKNWSSNIPKYLIQSMSGILRVGKTIYMLTAAAPYTAYIDLNTTRNLYITSSCLASYNTISNFENDVIIKKIPVKANYSQMLFDTASAGYDYLDVSRRALSRIDFRLQDSYGNSIDLRNNHWSFSLVFPFHNT